MNLRLKLAGLFAALAALASLGAAHSGPGDAVLADGDPPLTVAMVERLCSVYESILEVRLSPAQRLAFERGVIGYWKSRDRESMANALESMKFYGNQAGIEDLKRSSQSAIVQGLRALSDDPASATLVEAYDQNHAERASLARAVASSELVGTWKKQNALLANQGYDGRAVGVGYTDVATLVVGTDGHFTLTKTHEHCSGSGGCCRLDGSSAAGSLSIEGSKLVMKRQSGSALVRDDCNPSLSGRTTAKPHVSKFPFTLRRAGEGEPTRLCWNETTEEAVCLVKQ